MFIRTWDIATFPCCPIPEPLDGYRHFIGRQLRTATGVRYRPAYPLVILVDDEQITIAQLLEVIFLHIIHRFPKFKSHDTDSHVKKPILLTSPRRLLLRHLHDAPLLLQRFGLNIKSFKTKGIG